MPDMEKVIKGLEICTTRPCYCTDCPYKKECCLDSQNVMEDALILLKEQEPVKPKQHMNIVDCCSPSIVYGCGNCHSCVMPGWKYCRMCGRPVKWD